MGRESAARSRLDLNGSGPHLHPVSSLHEVFLMKKKIALLSTTILAVMALFLIVPPLRMVAQMFIKDVGKLSCCAE